MASVLQIVNGPGEQWFVEELSPKPIAMFFSREDAEVFVAARSASLEDQEATTPEPALTVEPSPEKPAAKATGRRCEADLQMAFTRLSNDDDMKVVAAAFDLDLQWLRGKWLQYRYKHPNADWPEPAPHQEATPDPDLAAAPSQAGEITDLEWQQAIAVLEAGEPMKALADERGLPFGKLRAKWAAHVRANPHLKRVKKGPAEILGDVLRAELNKNDQCKPERVQRKNAVWTDEIDYRVSTAKGDELADIAEFLDISLDRVKRRKEELLKSAAEAFK